MLLPADSHVHSEWSWDTSTGNMEQTCAQAAAIGLPGVAFTEHLDHTVWRLEAENPPFTADFVALAGPGGLMTPPPFDAVGYLAEIERCRDRFPQLRILSGLELGEPHRHPRQIGQILATGRFDRLLGSLHTSPSEKTFTGPWSLYSRQAAYDVVRDYLKGIAAMITTSDVFAVLAHIDYPLRYWPAESAGPFDFTLVEDEFRHALRQTANSGRALEVNSRLPMNSALLAWWCDEGGDAITFGSDAHRPAKVGHGFSDAARMADAYGFHGGSTPQDMWVRRTYL